jgi:hypothetical protein
MSVQSNAVDDLPEQFARLNGKIDGMAADIGNLKVRMSALEGDVGHVRIAVAEVKQPPGPDRSPRSRSLCLASLRGIVL